MNGGIDDVRTYHQALTAAQVQWLYDHPGEQLNDSGAYTGADHTITNTVSGWTDLELDNATATVTWRNANGATLASTTVSTTQNLSQAWSRDSTSAVNVTVEFEPTDPIHTARLFDEGVSADTFAPTVDNASLSPNITSASITGLPVTLEADINDTDFPTAQGDSVDAEFFIDGSSVGTDTLTSNGTAAVTVSSLMGGTHDWNVTLTDAYGHTATSATAQLAMPANLTFRNESNPDEILTGVTVDVTAYYSNETVTRTVTNGNLSLTDFPVDEPIIIRANSTEYYLRTAVLESVFNQKSVFLLPRNVSAYLDRLQLEDPTGDYPRADTVVFVQRDLNLSGSVEWRTITGDNFGINGVPVYLERDERYRIRIKNLETGQTAIMGSYTAIQSETVTISISGGVKPPTIDREYNWLLAKNDTAQTLTFIYNDTAQETTEVKLTIHERYNDSNVLVDNETFTGSNDIWYQTALTADQVNATWMAEIYVNRGDGFVHFREPVMGGQQSIIPFDLDAVWVQSIGVFLLLVIGTAFSAVNQGVGAITTSIIAGIMWIVGLFSGTAAAVAIVLALAISVGFHYRYERGVGS